MEKKSFRLPDGTYTTSGRKLDREWKKLYSPFCKVTGCVVIGFDPGVLFSADNRGYSSFALPVSVLVKLNQKLKK